jgi:hypothetical protein
VNLGVQLASSVLSQYSKVSRDGARGNGSGTRTDSNATPTSSHAATGYYKPNLYYYQVAVGRSGSKSREMEAKLSQLATLSQKDKTPAYLAFVSETLSRPDQPSLPTDLHVFIDTVTNPDIVGLVTGRQVISELVKNIGAGAVTDHDVRKRIVEDALATLQPRIASYEEQVCPFLPLYLETLTASPSGEHP